MEEVTTPDASADNATPVWSNNRLLGVLVVLLVLYTLNLAAPLVVPLLLALLLSLMLAPAVRLLNGWRIPRPLATLLVLGFTLVFSVSVLASLVAPAREWLARAPKAMDRIESVLRELRQPLAAASQATQEIISLKDGQAKPILVDITPGPLSQLLNATPAMLASSIVTLFLTFALLLHGDALLRKFVELAPQLKIKKEIVLTTRNVQSELSTYVMTLCLINTAVGLLTALTFWAIGVENPLLWGGIAGLLNFAPYIGPLLTVLILTVVGFTDFSAPLAAFAIPGAFLILHTIESQIVTPLVVGRRLALDPVVVFLAMVILGWLLGVAGLLLAVPLMTCLKILAEAIPQWQTLARVLSA